MNFIFSGNCPFQLLGSGLPIITEDNQYIDSTGISGATPELDELCAQAGLDAITENLN